MCVRTHPVYQPNGVMEESLAVTSIYISRNNDRILFLSCKLLIQLVPVLRIAITFLK